MLVNLRKSTRITVTQQDRQAADRRVVPGVEELDRWPKGVTMLFGSGTTNWDQPDNADGAARLTGKGE
jgi:hypothetical protein